MIYLNNITNIINRISNLPFTQKVILIIGSLIIIRLPLFIEWYGLIVNFNIFDDHAVIQFPYHIFADSELFQNDFMNDFISATNYRPIGYYYLNYLIASFSDIFAFGKTSAIVLWPITMISTGFIAWKLGGAFNCWLTLLIFSYYSLLVAYSGGAMEHSFAFPIFSLALLALVYGRYYALAFFTVLGALFYPGVPVVTGLTMAYMLLVADTKYHGDVKDKTTIFKWFLVCFTGIVSVASILYGFQLMLPTEMWTPITPNDYHLYPEVARMAYFARNQFLNFLLMFVTSSYRNPIVGLLCFFSVLFFVATCWNRYKKHDLKYHSILALLTITIIVMLITSWISAGYTYSVAKIPLLFLAILLVPIAISYCILGDKEQSSPLQKLSIFLVCILYIFTLKPIDKFDMGGTREITAEESITFDFIKTLQKDILIAGLPTNAKTESIVDFIPYVTKRSVLVMFKPFIGYYVEPTLEIRRRARALIDAFFATSTEPFMKLHQKWGVDYFIINLERLHKPLEWLGFEEYYNNKAISTSKEDLVIYDLIERYGVYSNGSTHIIDLNAMQESLSRKGE